MSKITKVSRCTNNTGIPVIILSKRSYGRALIIITVGINKFKFDFHFSPIKQMSYKQCNNYVSPISSRKTNNMKHHPNYSQSQHTTPNKFQSLYKGIPSMLQFMDSSNLHHNQQFQLTGSGIAQILLKIYKLDGVIPTFSHYSSQNNNTIITQEFWVPT